MVIAAQLVTAMQSIVSRNVSPTETAVLSVTQIHAGDAYNVIPERAHCAGTVRSFTLKAMQRVEKRMEEMIQGFAAAHGAKIEVDFRTVFHPVINDKQAATVAGDVAAGLVGEDNVLRSLPPGTGSEDFSFMLEKVPGCYLLLGNADADHQTPLHNPGYDFNDRASVYGASFFAGVVEHVLQ